MRSRAVIRELPASVVQRIAAGEVVQSVAAAVKELLENSLDAEAGHVDVTLHHDGGFCVVDDGHGIQFADLPLLCRRHATSKLTSWAELRTIQTLGFRGEALCSVSCVAGVTVTTRPIGENYGLKTSYQNGELSSNPTPCAALLGTTISVHGIFEQDVVRRRALDMAQEAAQIAEMLQSYAVYRPDVGFVLRSGRDVVFSVRSESRLERISKLFGIDVARGLLPVETKFGSSDDGGGEVIRFVGWVSGVGYDGHGRVFFLFVNGRRVDCAPLKRAIHALYASLFPKRLPFVYASLELPAKSVDVNVHPAKREVEFLFRKRIIQTVTLVIRERLAMAKAEQAPPPRENLPLPELQKTIALSPFAPTASPRFPDAVHHEGREIIRGHEYVGMTEGKWIFVYYDQGLYVLNLSDISHDYVRQSTRKNCSCWHMNHLQPALFLPEELRKAVDAKWLDDTSLRSADWGAEIASRVQALMSQRPLLSARFGLDISENGWLLTLPLPVKMWPVCPERIPSFLWSLSDVVGEWTEDTDASEAVSSIFPELLSVDAVPSRWTAQNLKEWVESDLLPAMKVDYSPSVERVVARSIIKLSSIHRMCSSCGR